MPSKHGQDVLLRTQNQVNTLLFIGGGGGGGFFALDGGGGGGPLVLAPTTLPSDVAGETDASP